MSIQLGLMSREPDLSGGAAKQAGHPSQLFLVGGSLDAPKKLASVAIK
jgi:hypothetical protein